MEKNENVERRFDPTNRHADLRDQETPNAVKHMVKGLPREKAMDIFNAMVRLGYAVSIKHLGGYYFVEVPVGLRGDPCYLENATVQQIAHNAGATTIQTGDTLRVIG